jgi:hypothetical protein
VPLDRVALGIVRRGTCTVAAVVEKDHLEAYEPVDVTGVAPHFGVAARPRMKDDRETVADNVVSEPKLVVLEVPQGM